MSRTGVSLEKRCLSLVRKLRDQGKSLEEICFEVTRLMLANDLSADQVSRALDRIKEEDDAVL